MNKRIKELAQEAGFQDGVWAPENSIAVHCGSELDKFAELIIKEAMQVVANNTPQNVYLTAAHAVIEHFKD